MDIMTESHSKKDPRSNTSQHSIKGHSKKVKNGLFIRITNTLVDTMKFEENELWGH